MRRALSFLNRLLFPLNHEETVLTSLLENIAVLQMIEVEVDAQGGIHPLQPLPEVRERRALLALVVPEQPIAQTQNASIQSLFGVLQARKGASLEAMDAAIHEHAKARFDDRN